MFLATLTLQEVAGDCWNNPFCLTVYLNVPPKYQLIKHCFGNTVALQQAQPGDSGDNLCVVSVNISLCEVHRAETTDGFFSVSCTLEHWLHRNTIRILDMLIQELVVLFTF